MKACPYLIIICLLLLPSFAMGQEGFIDSLKTALNRAENDTAGIRILIS